MSNKGLNYYQLIHKGTSTYSYLVVDPLTSSAIIIDPVAEEVERDLKLIHELGLNLCWITETHLHADHKSGASELRKKTGAKIALSEKAKASGVDCLLSDNDILPFGHLSLKAISTPGHTSACMSFLCEGHLFTGDTLLIRGCGRTDFQSGSSDALFSSVREKLFRLPDSTIILPGHDYKGFTKSSIGEEKKFNPRLNLSVTLEEFRIIMSELKLPPPPMLDENLKHNSSL